MKTFSSRQFSLRSQEDLEALGDYDSAEELRVEDEHRASDEYQIHLETEREEKRKAYARKTRRK